MTAGKRIDEKSSVSKRAGKGLSAGKRTGAGSARPQLSAERIIAAALAILDRHGFEGLSMRRLGRELGVDPMAIYYHIPGKQALLDRLVEVIMNEIDVSLDDRSRPPAERLLTAAHAYREALLAHPSLLSAVAHRPPRTLAGLKPVDTLLGIFLDADFSSPDALAAVNIFAVYVRGAAMGEAPYWFDLPESEVVELEEDFSQVLASLDPAEFPNIMRAAPEWSFSGMEDEFDRGARALIRGLLETYGLREGGRK